MHRVCVFAGSREGARPAYAAAARALGAAIARRGWGVVYGGASVGTMGAVADAALAAGGEVDGVIPRFMVEREVAHRGLTRLHVVGSMHERKAKMSDLAGAFVSLPGGFGTLDETFEIVTWWQIGLHAKPIALLDVDGYWEPLRRWIEGAVAAGFVPEQHARGILIDADVERVLDASAPG
jgi:uncharacterized protein (TIGR00730 family)